MIVQLTGTIADTGEDHAVIDVNGIGYLCQCSARTLRRLGAAGAAATVVTELSIRDERMILYGFADAGERDWFRRLTTVQGVGPRIALNILSVLDLPALASAIMAQDKAALAQADGVGARLAARIVAEMKDKVADLPAGSTIVFAPAAASNGEATPPIGTPSADAVSALVNLGYRRADAFGAVTEARTRLGDGADTGALIRDALRALSS